MSAFEQHRMRLVGESNAFQAITLFVENIAQDLKQAVSSGDMERVNLLLDDLHANKSQLAQAVLSGTPAANQLPKDLPAQSLNIQNQQPQRPPADTRFTGPRTAATATPPKAKPDEPPTTRAGQGVK